MTKSSGEPVKKARHRTNWWPEDVKIEVATLWAATKDYDTVSKLAKVPVGQIKKMMTEPWWQHVVDKVRKEKNDVLDEKITQALDKTVDIVLDRLQNGETQYYHKTGEYIKVPVKIREIAQMSAHMFTQRQLIRGEATTRTEVSTTEQKLAKMKETFEALANSKGINPKAEIIESEAEEIENGT